MTIANTNNNGGNNILQIQTTINIAKGSGNNRYLVVFVGAIDTLPGVTTVTLDPAGTPIDMNPLLDTSGDNLDQGVNRALLKAGIFVLEDSELPTENGVYTVQCDTANQTSSLGISVYYLEDVVQDVPELYGSNESPDTSTPLTNIGTPTAGADTMDHLCTVDPGGPSAYSADSPQVELFKALYFYVQASSYAEAESTFGWTDGDSGGFDNFQVYASLAPLGSEPVSVSTRVEVEYNRN